MGRLLFILLISFSTACSAINSLDDYSFSGNSDQDTETETDTDSQSDTSTTEPDSGTEDTESSVDTTTGGDTESVVDTGEDTCGAATYVQCQDDELVTFDSCDQPLEKQACGTHTVCVNTSTTAAECQCAGNWTGADCDQCSGNWTGADCDQCADGFGDRADNCGTCVRYVDLNPPAGSAGTGLSWSDARNVLQLAIFSARDAVLATDGPAVCEVWVKEGTYSPTEGSGNNASFLMAAGVHLYGGFADDAEIFNQRNFTANETILDGTGGADHVITPVDGTLVDGFTVRKGSPMNTGGPINSSGGAMLIGGLAVTVRNCFFSENTALSSGGALHVSAGGTLTVQKCRFQSNSARGGGAAIYLTASTALIEDSVFSDNSARYLQGGGSGGAIGAWDNSPLTIRRSTFTSNLSDSDGGGVFASGSPVILDQVVFSANKANSGGGLHMNGGTLSAERVGLFANEAAAPVSSELGGGAALFNVTDASWVNAIFHANLSGGYSPLAAGAGLYLAQSTVTMTNCTIASNHSGGTSEQRGGGIYSLSSTLDLLNTIIWGNVADPGDSLFNQNFTSVTSTWSAEYCDMQGAGGNPDDTLIDLDPLFVGTDDLHLKSGSPCIDEAISTGAPSIDYDGEARPNGNAWDIGAYEY